MKFQPATFLAGTLAVLASLSAWSQDLRDLEPGLPVTRTLTNGEIHAYRTAIEGEVLISVEQIGRGTILSVCEGSCGRADSRRLRVASWRGPEHFYKAVIDVGQDTVFQIEPDEQIAPAGDYRVTVKQYSRDEPAYAGERAMTLGADLHLRHYFGDTDARIEAAAQFDKAADVFEAINSRARLADARFEGAMVRYYLGDNYDAYEGFLAAEEIWRDLGDERGIAAAENQRGLVDQLLAGNIKISNGPSATELFEMAAELRLALGDTFFYAQAINNLGLVYQELGDGRLAVRYFSEALKAWQGSIDLMVVDPDGADFADAEQEPWLLHAVIAMMNLGWAYDHSARPDLAERHYEQALALTQHLGRGRLAAEIRSNYGQLMYRTGDLQSALTLMQRALEYFESDARDETWSAEVYNNLGLVYAASGDSERARASFGEALRLRTAERDPVGRAESLRNLALLGISTDPLPEVLALVDEALNLLGSRDAARTERAALHDIAGRAYVHAKDTQSATDHFDEALELYRGTGNLAGETNTRANRAYALHVAGRDIRATAELDVALDLARQIESLSQQFSILTRMARVRFDRHEYDLALSIASEAIRLSESLRGQLAHPALLRDYASVQQDAYDVLINAAIRTGDVERAWMESDRARARRFTELLQQTGAALSEMAAGEQQRYMNLRLRVAMLAEQRSGFLAQSNTERASEVRRELVLVLNEMDALSGQAHTQSFAGHSAVDLETLQSMLEPTDLLLEYYLSPLGAGVWRVSNDSFAYIPLPDYAEIETGTLMFRQALTSGTASVESETEHLSALLFGAEGEMLAGSSRLIFIPDGALHLLPFAVLQDPAQHTKEPLIFSREVTYLPSTAALFELRRRTDHRGEGIAIMADPVFEAGDPRVDNMADAEDGQQVASLGSDARRGAATIVPNEFRRLPATRDESRAIRESAGDQPIRLLLDTDANRDVVLSGELARYRILHFATHGVLDLEEPALSGLVLSAVTAEGQPRPKFLLTQDIASLELAADLVVLSGCDTGFGRAVRGEGLISLSRAFFYAGAEQVISSLWQVPDRATAELMRVFYERLLQYGESPASALRVAQLHVMSDRRWRSPYFWAAFVLQGDWTSSASAETPSASVVVAQFAHE